MNFFLAFFGQWFHLVAVSFGSSSVFRSAFTQSFFLGTCTIDEHFHLEYWDLSTVIQRFFNYCFGLDNFGYNTQVVTMSNLRIYFTEMFQWPDFWRVSLRELSTAFVMTQKFPTELRLFEISQT